MLEDLVYALEGLVVMVGPVCVQVGFGQGGLVVPGLEVLLPLLAPMEGFAVEGLLPLPGQLL